MNKVSDQILSELAEHWKHAAQGGILVDADNFNMMVAEIADLRAETRWVPCEEGVPLSAGPYWVEHVNGVSRKAGERYWGFNGSWVYHPQFDGWKPTHWRPLPKGPKNDH